MSTMKTARSRSKSVGVAPSTTTPATETGKPKTPAPKSTHKSSSSTASATAASNALRVQSQRSTGLLRRTQFNTTALRPKNPALGASKIGSYTDIGSPEGQRGDNDGIDETNRDASQQEKQALEDATNAKSDATLPIRSHDTQPERSPGPGAATKSVSASSSNGGMTSIPSSSPNTPRPSSTTTSQIPFHRRVLKHSQSSISSRGVANAPSDANNATRPPTATSPKTKPKPATPGPSVVSRHAKTASTGSRPMSMPMPRADGTRSMIGKANTKPSTTSAALAAASTAKMSNSSGARHVNNTQSTAPTVPNTPLQRRERTSSLRASPPSKPTVGSQGHISRGSTSTLPSARARNTGDGGTTSTTTSRTNASSDKVSNPNMSRSRSNTSISTRPSKTGLSTTAATSRELKTRPKSTTTLRTMKNGSQPAKATADPAQSSASSTTLAFSHTHPQTNSMVSALQTDLLHYHLLYTRHQESLADLVANTTASLQSDYQHLVSRWHHIRSDELAHQRAANLSALARFADRAGVIAEDGLARQLALLEDVVDRVEDITSENGAYTYIMCVFGAWLDGVMDSAGRWQRDDDDDDEQEPPMIIEALSEDWCMETQRLAPELSRLHENLACIDVPPVPVAPLSSSWASSTSGDSQDNADAQSALFQIVNLHRQLVASMQDALRTMSELQTGVLTAQRVWISQEVDGLLASSALEDDQEKRTEWVPAWVS